MLGSHPDTKDITMMNTLLMTLALAAPLSASAAPQAATDKARAKADVAPSKQPVQDQAETIDAALAELDKDKDGKISKAEAAPVAELARYFDPLDADKDGFISRAEMQAAMTAAQASGAR
jgi:hypothetical protein